MPSDKPLRFLDLCTGTGCIPLLLYSLLRAQSTSLQALGVDISTTAVKLAKRNLAHTISQGLLPASASSHITFLQRNIFTENPSWTSTSHDIVISNPPYISPTNYNHTTTRSVRNHEPKLALVPQSTNGNDEAVGDAFYPRIIAIAQTTKAKLLAMEVGDMQQAKRVVEMVAKSKVWGKIEIWRDGISDHGNSPDVTDRIGEHSVTVRGTGEGRVVVGWTNATVPKPTNF
ncbi:MAG: hypothetical protein Q9221_002525 [Calogaya cf. arnoldii]